MKNSALICDLDDTLMDTKIRHYKILFDFVTFNNKTPISFREYLDVRKIHGLTNAQIIDEYYPEVQNSFTTFWKDSIESLNYLRFDQEIVNKSLLEEVIQIREVQLILLSIRSQTETAIQQWQTLSFSHLFQEIIFVPHDTTNPKGPFLNQLKLKYDHLLFISDTESDMKTSMKAEVNFLGVSTGFYPISCSKQFSDINHLLLSLIS